VKLLVTGGAGFIGSNFIRFIFREHTQWEVTNVDKLTYAGNLENLRDVRDEPRYRFVRADIADRDSMDELLSQGFNAIVNFAAESHVDRSILDASPFLETNVKGTQILLEGVKKYDIQRFVQISTDEVYGSINEGFFMELSPLSPSSPYAASKAAGDLLCLAYWKTYRTPMIITRCSNNFGPYQFPEKLIPLVVTNALEDKPIPVYGDGLNVRDWNFVVDYCRALDLIVQKGKPGEIYNVAAGKERTNLQVIGKVLQLLDKPKSLVQFVSDRPGHDRRYAMDTAKIAVELGWKPTYSFEAALTTTVNWYLENQSWWRQIKSGEYAKYYERLYLQR